MCSHSTNEPASYTLLPYSGRKSNTQICVQRLLKLNTSGSISSSHGATTEVKLLATSGFQVKLNGFLLRENNMFEDYLRRVHPNMDRTGTTDNKAGQRKKKRGDVKKDSFVPLTAEEKSNICSHQLDYVLQKVGEVERKGQDEISEVLWNHAHVYMLVRIQPFLTPVPSTSHHLRDSR
jgi:hypothetical protein